MTRLDRPVLDVRDAVDQGGLARGDTVVRALRGVTLTVRRGEYVAIMGSSGSRQVDADEHPRLSGHPDDGALPAGRGRRRAAQRVATGARSATARIGFVFQSFNLIARTAALAERRAAAGLRRRAGRPSTSAGPRRRWRWSAWPTGPTTSPTSCPAASSSGWRWPGRWSPRRRWCWPTSRPATWTVTSTEDVLDVLDAARTAPGRTIVSDHPRAGRGRPREPADPAGRRASIVADVTPTHQPLGVSRRYAYSAKRIRFALRGISANKLRSGLTVLGILIGVAAVILLVAVGNGSAKSIRTAIEGLGTNTVDGDQRRRPGGRTGHPEHIADRWTWLTH